MADPTVPVASGQGARSVEDLYQEHFTALMRVAYLMTGSNAVAEDLVHDVFVRCYAQLTHLDDARSYLRASVVNACRRHHRRDGRRSAERATDCPEPPTAEAVAVRQALMAMSPKRRAALVLRFYEDLTHDNIAEVLDCRPSTVRSLVRRGLNDLRGALHES